MTVLSSFPGCGGAPRASWQAVVVQTGISINDPPHRFPGAAVPGKISKKGDWLRVERWVVSSNSGLPRATGPVFWRDSARPGSLLLVEPGGCRGPGLDSRPALPAVQDRLRRVGAWGWGKPMQFRIRPYAARSKHCCHSSGGYCRQSRVRSSGSSAEKCRVVAWSLVPSLPPRLIFHGYASALPSEDLAGTNYRERKLSAWSGRGGL